MQQNNFYRQLGNTGFNVSALGLGTVKFGRNTGVKYPNTFEIPNDKEILNILSKAKDLGINLIDTAPAYGASEERLGKLLSNRNSWIICNKVGESFQNNASSFDFSKKAILESVNASLKKLKTDYIDIMLIHSNGNDLDIINNYEVFNTLDELKKLGKIRFSGMSSKTIEGGELTLDYSDVAMISYNPTYKDEYPVIKKAKDLNKGIIIKKALASGHLNKISSDNPIEESFEFILKQDSVSSIIIGTINLKHLEENINIAKKLSNNLT